MTGGHNLHRQVRIFIRHFAKFPQIIIRCIGCSRWVCVSAFTCHLYMRPRAVVLECVACLDYMCVRWIMGNVDLWLCLQTPVSPKGIQHWERGGMVSLLRKKKKKRSFQIPTAESLRVSCQLCPTLRAAPQAPWATTKRQPPSWGNGAASSRRCSSSCVSPWCPTASPASPSCLWPTRRCTAAWCRRA